MRDNIFRNYGSIRGAEFSAKKGYQIDVEEEPAGSANKENRNGNNQLGRKLTSYLFLGILILTVSAFASVSVPPLSALVATPGIRTTGSKDAQTDKEAKNEHETFQVPFPHINRAEYGTNSVPASSIVDPELFSPSLRGVETDGTSPLLKVPFPTGAFWTNLVVKPTDDQLLSYPIMAYPYGFKWNPEKLQVSYPALRRLLDEISIRDIFNPDLTLKTREDVTNRHVTYFDPLSVTLRFESASSRGGWEVYLVQGSPYITARYDNVTPVIQPVSIFKGISCLSMEDVKQSSGSRCESPDGSDQTTIPPAKFVKLKGTQFIITTRENLSWMLFTSEPVSLIFDNIRKTTISTESDFTGLMRLALLPPPLGETIDYTSQFPEFYDEIKSNGNPLSSSSGVRALTKYSDVYPTGAEVSWNFPSKNLGHIEFKYKTKLMTAAVEKEESFRGRAEDLLMLALPHHVDVIPSPSSNCTTNCFLDEDDFDLVYRTIKGHMTPVVSSIWSYDENLTTIGVDDPDDAIKNAAKLDDQTKELILNQVAFDLTRVQPTLDENIYGFGKQLARLAQLVHIARVLVTTSSSLMEDGSYWPMIEYGTTAVHDFVTAFLSGKNSDILVYDNNFGGLVTRDGLNDFMGDFGNGWYNDHHFHYGYYLYACALLGRWNSTFVSEYGSTVDAIMFDVTYSSHVNSEQQTTDGAFFPLARHKSWYDSHSFASGLFPFASGKSMESSSESINCYYGAYLWSTVRETSDTTKGRDQLNFARLLLAMEIRGVKTYWHMSPHNTGDVERDSRLYDATFEKNMMVGNLGMMDVTVSTWFGRNPLYVHMINFMPITGITRQLFDVEYLKQEFKAVIEPIYADVEMAWKGYVVCDLAMIDPNAAWDDALELRSYELDQAISQSQVLYFISTTDGFKRPKATTGRDEESNESTSVSTDSAFCWDHPACKALSLAGFCCPTKGGTNLGCCNGGYKSDAHIETSDNDSNLNDNASCSENLRCAELGLNGLCCPTNGGTNLGCCDGIGDESIALADAHGNTDIDSGEKSSGSLAFCSENQGCAALDLSGLCCPTADGENLSCCD